LRRKIIITITILLLLILNPISSFASEPPTNLQEAVSLANDELGYEYFIPINSSGQSLNWVMIKGVSGVTIGNTNDTYSALVYGAPHGDTKGSEYRYIGYTKNGEDFTNPDFPHDAWAGGYLEDRNWITAPWVNVPGNFRNDFDGDSKYLPNIQKGLALYYADITKGGDSPYWNSWHEYVHILVPPTKYTWGMGRMWHQTSSGIWYISIPLTPGAMTEPVPELVVTPSTATVKVGEGQQFKATFYPEGQINGNGQDVTFQSNWSTSDTSIASIGANTGYATGNSPGTVEVVATYTPPFGETITGKAQLIVEEEEELSPPEEPVTYSGSLILQARGEIDNVKREPGKALWTDIVEATLNLPVQNLVTRRDSVDYKTTVAPPRPPQSECGTSKSEITGWRIVRADLSYPKQNPDFTFGHPLPPVGQVTIPMKISKDGHSATATFKEDWALDGAFIYDMLTDSLINQEPKNYPITVSNIVVEVDYKTTVYHEEEVRKCSGKGEDRVCWTETICVPETETGSYTQRLDSVTAPLLVYGTAVNILGQ